MDKTQYLLLYLAEEAQEVGQAASKAARFGLHDTYRGYKGTTLHRLLGELNDLEALKLVLQRENVLPVGIVDEKRIERKIRKIHRMMRYSKNRKMLK